MPDIIWTSSGADHPLYAVVRSGCTVRIWRHPPGPLFKMPRVLRYLTEERALGAMDLLARGVGFGAVWQRTGGILE